MKYLPVFCLLIALGGCNQDETQQSDSSSAKVASVEVFEYGIYKIVQMGQVIDDPGTSTGKSLKNTVLQLDHQTDRIPIKKDVYMGYRFRIKNLPAEILTKPQAELRRVLVHPKMTLPDGSQKTSSERMIKRAIKDGKIISLDGYALNEKYEMVAGEWMFQIWYRDQKLVEKHFITYWPDKAEKS